MFKTHRTFDLTTGVKNATISVVNTTQAIYVVYHKTLVFSYNRKTNKIHLDNGGWNTISTRTVINNALSQVDGFGHFRLENKSRTCYLKSCYLDKPIEMNGVLVLSKKNAKKIN